MINGRAALATLACLLLVLGNLARALTYRADEQATSLLMTYMDKDHPYAQIVDEPSGSFSHETIPSDPGVMRRQAVVTRVLPSSKASSGSLQAAAVRHKHGKTFGAGHITVGGPWVSFRSLTVATDHDSVDGFFLQVNSDDWGRRLAAIVTRNGTSLPYALSMNFHGPIRGTLGRNWLGGCTGILLDEDLKADVFADIPSCAIPTGAITVEITSYSGADLDVVVEILHEADESAGD